MTAHLLGKRSPTKKLLQAVAGVWVFLAQFNRATMVLMHDIWRAIEGHYDAQGKAEVCRREFLALIGVLPLMVMDFRLPLSEVVTASDASEEGAWGLHVRPCHHRSPQPTPIQTHHTLSPTTTHL